MNKTLVGILIGLLLGAGATWFALHSRGNAGAEPAKAEAKAEEKPNPLFVSAAKRTAAGIVVAKPTESTIQPEVPAFVRVIDTTPLILSLAEVDTAHAAKDASQKELERVKKLFAADQNASAQALEIAEANATRDGIAEDSAQARLLAAWGADVAKNSETINSTLKNAGKLARLDVLPGDLADTAPKHAYIEIVSSGKRFEVPVLGTLPIADPQVQGMSYLVLLGDLQLPAGAALRGSLPGVGETTQTLIIPRSAIVYHQGSAWVFVLGEEDIFARKLVSLGRSLADANVVITQGLEATDQVVTTGAQQLLAAELQAGGAPEED